MGNLEEIKKKVVFDAVDEETNAILMSWLMKPTDCFGKRYDPDDQKFCGECIVMTDIDSRKEPLCVFCKELCEQVEQTPDPTPELKEAIQETQTKKEEKIRVKEAPPWKVKLVSLIGTMENKLLVDSISAEFGIDAKKVRLTLAGVLSSQAKKARKI